MGDCSPPLRPRDEVEAVWAEVLAGNIPMIASDHSPSPPELKQGGHEGHVASADLLYRHPQSPFVGAPTRSRVVRTLLRGNTVLADGRLVAGSTFGRIVRPEL